MRLSSLSSAMGLEVRGLALDEPVSDAVQSELRSLLAEHALLYFPEQDLSPDDHERVMSYFGPLDENPDGSHGFNFANVDTGGANDVVYAGDFLFHSDAAFTPHPLLAISLYATAIEGPVGDTIFANSARAYECLSPDLRERCDTLTAVQVADYRPPPDKSYLRVRLPDLVPEPSLVVFPRTQHPVAYPHPRTGKKVLFILEHMTSHIVGLPLEESETLISELYDVVYDDSNIYNHTWAKGDLLIWDNVTLQHKRSATPEGSLRMLRRMSAAEVPWYQAQALAMGVEPDRVLAPARSVSDQQN